MILLIIAVFVVVPTAWGILTAVRELFLCWWDLRSAKPPPEKTLFKSDDREIYEGGPLVPRVVEAFKYGFVAATFTLIFFGLLGWLVVSCIENLSNDF